MTPSIELPANISIHDVVGRMTKYCSPEDLDTVRLAYEAAEAAHRGQFRKSGEPYIIHPLATAYILALFRMDPAIVAAALLHDVPEDTAVTLEDIERDFGADIAHMIAGITKLGKLKYRGVERYMENLRKMFVAMAEDVRVMIIKFADRTHNLMTLDALDPEKKRRVALESLEIYAPIANRLGMAEFKGLLEDLSFKHLYPNDYARVVALRDKILAGEEKVIDEALAQLRSELNKAGVKAISIYGRKKQLYSFYQKLQEKGWDGEKVYDVFALRVILGDVGDCYATLGIIHQLFRPLKGRIKDYIAQPKPNGYQSLHTTVFTAEGKIIEFQIRTREMHEEAEFGVAAHWHYDERGSRRPQKDISWAKELAEIQKEVLVNFSDLEELKVDFFRNRIFVFTPNGDVIDLPEDATPIDFAYHIHSEVGNKCTAVRVNDRISNLDTPLKSGDVVEIITDKNRKNPSPDWLKIARTHVARSHIKQALKSRTSVDSWLKLILPKKKPKISPSP